MYGSAYMSDLSNLKFPSGRTVQQLKKDAKRLKKSAGITLTEAQNLCAKENGISLSWDKAIEEIKQLAFSKSLLDEQIFVDNCFRPSKDYFDLLNQTGGFPPKRDYPSLEINLSRLPSHVYESLLCHPKYIHFIESFMALSDFKLEVKHPHRTARYLGEDWRFDIKFDGFSGEGDKPCNAMWREFKDWIMQFSTTNRVMITERIDSPSYAKLVTQTLQSWTLLDFANKLKLDVDRAFYCQIVNDALPIEQVQWRNTDLTVLFNLHDEFESHMTTALFEYSLNGEVDTVASQTQGSMQDYNIVIRTLQLYMSALNSVMRHYKLNEPSLPMKLLKVEMGKELFFGVTQVR